MGLLRRHRRRLSEDASENASGSALDATAPSYDGSARANDNDAAYDAELERELHERDVPSSDLIEVPAAVVCLVCHELDCPGCEEGEVSRSGIVAVVAWERSGQPALSRLWTTARSATRDAETFFELMPDGPLLPALRFAALCEMFATTAMLAALLPIVGLAAPTWLGHVALDPHARSVALRLGFVGIPTFAAFLVFAHVVHALFIHVGAGRCGVRRSRSRAIRFGLYACGWDLVMGPLGIIVVGIKEGLSSALGVLDLASVPLNGTRAFLRGCYGLDGERAKKAVETATMGAVIATVMGLFAVIGVLVVLALL